MVPDGVFQWIFGEFIPFGDLVSDLALVATLPSTDDAEGGSSYQLMSWVLWVGTFVSSIPEVAVIFGLLTGLAIGAVLGPATFSAQGEGKEVLSSTFDQTISLARYVCSDSKAITRFLLYYTKEVPPGWNNAVALAARHVFFVPLFPFAYPLVRLWERVSRNQDDAGRSWYSALILVQVVGGLMTEVSSIYFAVSTNNGQSIASALFGMYSLFVSTLISRLKGPKNANEEESFAQRSQKLAATSGQQIMKYGPVGVAVVVGLGLLTMPFVGVYFILACRNFYRDHGNYWGDCESQGRFNQGAILTSVGFSVLGLLWLFSFVFAYIDGDGVATPQFAMVFFSGLGILLTGLGSSYASYEGRVRGENSKGYVIALLFFGCLTLFVVVPAIWFYGKLKRGYDEDDPVADRGSTSAVRGLESTMGRTSAIYSS